MDCHEHHISYISASAGQAALESFQECVGVLEESMQRIDVADDSSNISFRSSILKV